MIKLIHLKKISDQIVHPYSLTCHMVLDFILIMVCMNFIYFSEKWNDKIQMRRLWQTNKRLYIPMHCMRFPNASMLCHAQHRNWIPKSSTHSQTYTFDNNHRGRNKHRSFQHDCLQRVQETKVGESVSVHGV